ncbi:MAG: hypothetical protein HFI34_11205 [Lachnospiraceae bacterium]|nr:hypothetical protein [Lachnospiraceae bacterium]
MKIEIAEPGRMTQSGSSLLKLIQNNNMPILDLLVRESIQNSLDAKNESDAFVSVDFLTGMFDKASLNAELDRITNSLNQRYDNDKYKYIAIRDLNTVGLTGKLHYDDVIDNQYGNLLKLIYEISKPQEAEGAGGSWGLGKTVYFRVGIGLVIYYSRIINENGQYESRLAASLVENEMEKDALIPALDGKSKRGIAWWGEEIGNNKTRPITDESYIKYILDIFGIKPYEQDKTGTTIIIPYIDEDVLLNHNQIEYKDGEDNVIHPYWRSNIEEYLKIAIQRWYAPRLNNINYSYGKFLKAKINETGISLDVMEPAFQIVQALYNRAIGKKVGEDILDHTGVETKAEDIILRKVLNTTKAGTVAYTKVSRNILKTGFPDNKPEPYMYYNCEIREKDKNKPVVFFTRKPGMIVSYQDVGNWVDGISSSNRDEFIMAIFVLNSDNTLTVDEPNYRLEEYIRKSERADHTSWSDFSMGSFNPRIVSKVQGQVISKISKEFSIEGEETTSKFNSGLGKMFGDLLLPPENFGKKPSSGLGPSPKLGSNLKKHKNVLFGYDSADIEYYAGGMIVKLIIKSKKKIESTGVVVAINSESGTINHSEWENKMGLTMPFEIIKADIKIKRLDEYDINSEITVDKDNVSASDEKISCTLNKSDKEKGYGVHIEMEKEHSVEIEITVKLKFNRRDVKPLFMIEKDGDK